MIVLGLLPPYALEDLKACYRDKVLSTHPDRGGNAKDFHRLQEAYEHATRYLEVRGNLRAWIAARVEPHLRQEEIVAEVRRRGGEVKLETLDWLKPTLGEGFAHLEERLRGIELHGPGGGDAFLDHLAAHHADVPYLLELDLAGSPVTNGGLKKLTRFQTLRRLNLARTAVTARGLGIVLSGVPQLQWLNGSGLRIPWWSRWWLSRTFPHVEFVWTNS
jgi:hypothetical protein